MKEELKEFWMRSQQTRQVYESYQAGSHLKAVSKAFGIAVKSLRESGVTGFDYVSETRDKEGNVDRAYWIVKGEKK